MTQEITKLQVKGHNGQIMYKKERKKERERKKKRERLKERKTQMSHLECLI